MALSFDPLKSSINRVDLATEQHVTPSHVQPPPTDSLEQPSESSSSSSKGCFACICALLASFFRYLFCMSKPREKESSPEEIKESIVEKEKTQTRSSLESESISSTTSSIETASSASEPAPTPVPATPTISSPEKTEEESPPPTQAPAAAAVKKSAEELEEDAQKKFKEFLLRVKNNWSPRAHEDALKEATDDFKQQEVGVQNKIFHHLARHQMFNLVALYLDLLPPARKQSFEVLYGRTFKPTEISREWLLKIFKAGF